jgi:1,4-alpha-glucan branching enzyme
MTRTLRLTAVWLNLLLATLVSAQPTIDGIFDGVTTWGTAIATADGTPGWASVDLDQLYVTTDTNYAYIAVTYDAVADWQSWGIAINTTDNAGGAAEVWGYPITYGHTELPDVVVKGHFGQGGTSYAEVRTWNNGWIRSDNSGVDAPLAAADFSADEAGIIEVRIAKSLLSNAVDGDIQVYISGDNGSEHATFDALPDDEVAPGWNASTTLDNYVTDVPLGGSPVVTVIPTMPTDAETITITFDASSTALAGASAVYCHAGVSVTSSDLTAFDHVIGNWGQDDGVGIMTNLGGDMWQLTISDSRSYFNVPSTTEVFGLNFLFRNSAGTVVEDQGGQNYNIPTDPGAYFTIDSPAEAVAIAEINEVVNLDLTASETPISWTVEEIDNAGSSIQVIGSGGATLTYSTTITSATPTTRYYKVTAQFASGVKYKDLTIITHTPVVEAPRPAGMEPGINYHSNDATKATLILHAPTYTRYYKHPQGQPPVVSGTNMTAEFDVVYVLGDFNNWTVSEAYKMNRDRDGYDPSTGVDGDGDGDRGDYWWLEVTGLTAGQEYVFQYLLDDGTQVADPYTHKVSDVEDAAIDSTRYPNLIAYPSQAQDRASVLQTAQSTYTWTAPPFTKPDNNDLNIYELHFRDFTEEGTYLSAIEKLDYIKALGINAIHVMPVSEFEGNNSWGYNPNFYFAADKYYGTADDLRTFIDECHKREIQVFNDLVLNHAFYSSVMARMYWNDVDNKPANDNPWFNPDHRMVADQAGWWGADWNHESEHTQRMVDRAIDYWLQEFQFDGYRFDFTKGIGQTMPDTGDPWASTYDQDRIDLLMRLVNGMWNRNPGSVAIFEHLANSSEDAVLANAGILMWSGAGHHNQIKNFQLGFNGADIYSSGIFSAQGFTFANWMSYMESHDEERQAYEIMTFGSNSGSYTTEEVVDRLKLGTSFNLLFPGPRMIWQFGELAYDVPINFNGRTGEKPVRWEYYFDTHRHELWRLMSQCLHLRNTTDLYATTPDYGNIGSTAGVNVPRYMKLHDGSGKHVVVIANLDPDNPAAITPGYPTTGTWYRYNGDPAIDGTTYMVNNTGDSYTLQPSESLILTNYDIQWQDDCDDAEVCCVQSVYTWIGGNGDWHIPSNWDRNAVPKPCDMVIIPTGSTVEVKAGSVGYARYVMTMGNAQLLVNGDLEIKIYPPE